MTRVKLGLLVGLVAVLGLGAFLRLVWPEDIEYKGDEAWTYQRVQEVQNGGPVPSFGMPSSQEILNPGMSLWVFIGLGQIFPVEHPPDLARLVQVSNVLALGLLILFICRVVPTGEREIWLWAAALVAVNPLAVLFHRKIWPPSLFPLLIVLFLWCWWQRERWMMALGWGLIGALLGQIHIPGFFFAAGFVLWAFLIDHRKPAWSGWLTGSLLGGIPLLPWLYYLTFEAVPRPSDGHRWVHLFEGRFWLRWILEPFGFGLDYSLGKQFVEFLPYPVIFGQPTFGVLLLHLAAGGLLLVVVGRALRLSWEQRRNGWDHFTGRGSPTASCVAAALWGYGILMTLSCFPIHRHYMIVLFPLQFVWLARLALQTPHRPATFLRGRGLLLALVLIQALLTSQFLVYVHDIQKIQGDYGPTYASQMTDKPSQQVSENRRP